MDAHKSLENEFFSIENANMSKSEILPNDQFDKRELEDEHGIERPFTSSDHSIQVGNDQEQQNSKIITVSQTQSMLLQKQEDLVAVTQETNETSIPDLEQCPNCRRKFFIGRLHLHLKICTPTNPYKIKYQESDTESIQLKIKYQSNQKSEVIKLSPKIKKKRIQLTCEDTVELSQGDSKLKVNTEQVPKWKQQHLQIVEGVKYIREVEKAQKNGTNIKDILVPKNLLEENYIFCQFCRRKFDPYVAERHIPRCKDIFNRPQPPKNKSSSQNHKKATVKALEKYSQYVGGSINEEVEEVDNDTIQQHSQTVKTLIQKKQPFRDGQENRMSQSQQQGSNGSSVFLPRIISPPSYIPVMSRSTPMVECTKCKRSFDERAAQRHIPICQQQLIRIDDKSLAKRLSPQLQQIPNIDLFSLNSPENPLLKGDKQFCTNCGAKYAQIHKYCGLCGKKRS